MMPTLWLCVRALLPMLLLLQLPPPAAASEASTPWPTPPCPEGCVCEMTRELEVRVRCEGMRPVWNTLPSNTTAVAVRSSLIPVLDGAFMEGSNLPLVVDLYLRYNEIEMVRKNATCGLPSLLTLDLSHNRLEWIAPDSLTCSPQLRTLILSHNPLLAVSDSDPFLVGLPNLSRLLMRHCGLTTVPDTLLEVSRQVDVRGNLEAARACRALRVMADLYDRLLCDAPPRYMSDGGPWPYVWRIVLGCSLAAGAVSCIAALIYRFSRKATVYRRVSHVSLYA